MKIIRNVYVNPNDVKVRSLRTSNPALKTKLKDAAVCFVVLKQAGFAKTTKDDGETWYTISTASNASGSLSQSDLKRLEQVYGALSTVADDFMIPLNERPSLDAQSSSSSTSASEPALPSRQTSFEFDPFRTNVIGMSGAPTVRFESAGGSTLGQQVAQLKAKRDAIMRSAGTTVENRQLIAIAYSSDFNPRRFLAAEEEEEEEDGASVTTDYDAEERAVIAMHQKAMQEKQKKAENFQTKAMREYDQLSKARVYTRTLIRITFPDRSVLQGLFCPLETIEDLQDAVCSACPSASKSDFTLLTGPPPQRLDAPAVTLESLGLFPAASLQLTSPSPTKVQIRKDLFTTDSALINARVPKGEPLVPRAAAGARSSIAAGGKPKWLKL